MAGADSWRDSSNWRTRDAASAAAPSTVKQPRSIQNRGTTPSWRTKEAGPSDGEPQRESRGDWVLGSRPFDRERIKDNKAQSDEGASTQKAIAEGRRIYMGNLRYQAKPDDIEGLLDANGLGGFVKIHISIDPFTGRNPSYCFVEFADRDSADRAMTTLEGKPLLGREVKCRPCIPKGGASGGRQNAEAPNRWGDWSGEAVGRDGEGGELASGRSLDGTEEDVSSSFNRYTKDFTGQRLYVGGLPRMQDQATNFAEISELFKNFQVEAISKRVTAHASARAKPGRHDFCFVDFATPEQAEAAREAINGTSFHGGRLKVSLASGRSTKWNE
ncbi:RNA-binding domain-containing protein [Hypoxylon crocopeplum]|nr:RNA-binding domain-containing protein [Hypoxylon crocopeplum]